MRNYRSFLMLCAMGLAVTVGATGCTSPAGKGRPPLTFKTIAPLSVTASHVDVVSTYSPTKNARDVSQAYATPPEVALRNYAQNRLRPSGSGGTFKFVIEDASVYHKEIAPENAVGQWMGVGKLDDYEISIKLRLYGVDASGRESEHSLMAFKRSKTMPASLSLNDKDREQALFLENLMMDVDAAVTKAVQAKHGGGPAMPTSSSLTGPGSMPTYPSTPVTSEPLSIRTAPVDSYVIEDTPF